MEAKPPCPPSFFFPLPPPLVVTSKATFSAVEAKMRRPISPLLGYGFPYPFLSGERYSFDMPLMGGGGGFTELVDSEEDELKAPFAVNKEVGEVRGAKGKSVSSTSFMPEVHVACWLGFGFLCHFGGVIRIFARIPFFFFFWEKSKTKWIISNFELGLDFRGLKLKSIIKIY